MKNIKIELETKALNFRLPAYNSNIFDHGIGGGFTPSYVHDNIFYPIQHSSNNICYVLETYLRNKLT